VNKLGDNTYALPDYIVSQKTTLMLHTITLTHINRFLVIFGRDIAE